MSKQCEHKWKSLDIKDIIGTLEFESSKSTSYKSNYKKENIADFEKSTFYKDYENDIIMVRNNLAHCISYQEGNKEILKSKERRNA